MTFFSSPVMGRDRSRTLVVAVVICNLHVAPSCGGAFPFAFGLLPARLDGPGQFPCPLPGTGSSRRAGRNRTPPFPFCRPRPPLARLAEPYAETRPTISASLSRMPSMDPIAGTRSRTDCPS